MKPRKRRRGRPRNSRYTGMDVKEICELFGVETEPPAESELIRCVIR